MLTNIMIILYNYAMSILNEEVLLPIRKNIMSKGNKPQKNDKKNKKPKQGSLASEKPKDNASSV